MALNVQPFFKLYLGVLFKGDNTFSVIGFYHPADDNLGRLPLHGDGVVIPPFFTREGDGGVLNR